MIHILTTVATATATKLLIHCYNNFNHIPSVLWFEHAEFPRRFSHALPHTLLLLLLVVRGERTLLG
mgnify:CR=1 FL=1